MDKSSLAVIELVFYECDIPTWQNLFRTSHKIQLHILGSHALWQKLCFKHLDECELLTFKEMHELYNMTYFEIFKSIWTNGFWCYRVLYGVTGALNTEWFKINRKFIRTIRNSEDNLSCRIITAKQLNIIPISNVPVLAALELLPPILCSSSFHFKLVDHQSVIIVFHGCLCEQTLYHKKATLYRARNSHKIVKPKHNDYPILCDPLHKIDLIIYIVKNYNSTWSIEITCEEHQKTREITLASKRSELKNRLF